MAKTNGNGKKRINFLGLLNEESKNTEYYKLYKESEIGFAELCQEVVRDVVCLIFASHRRILMMIAKLTKSR